MTHDDDDPPPRDEWNPWFYLNRWAEEMMRFARAFGFLAAALLILGGV